MRDRVCFQENSVHGVGKIGNRHILEAGERQPAWATNCVGCWYWGWLFGEPTWFWTQCYCNTVAKLDMMDEELVSCLLQLRFQAAYHGKVLRCYHHLQSFGKRPHQHHLLDHQAQPASQRLAMGLHYQKQDLLYPCPHPNHRYYL